MNACGGLATMPGSELWSVRRIAGELGFASPGAARKWLSQLAKAGHPVPPAEVAQINGRYTPLYDPEVVLAGRKVLPGRKRQGRCSTL